MRPTPNRSRLLFEKVCSQRVGFQAQGLGGGVVTGGGWESSDRGREGEMRVGFQLEGLEREEESFSCSDFCRCN